MSTYFHNYLFKVRVFDQVNKKYVGEYRRKDNFSVLLKEDDRIILTNYSMKVRSVEHNIDDNTIDVQLEDIMLGDSNAHNLVASMLYWEKLNAYGSWESAIGVM